MNLGAPELLIILLLGFIPLALVLVAVVDASSRPDWAWRQAGQGKVMWITLMIIGLFVCGLGLALALVYLFAIRPQVARAQEQAPAASGPPVAGPAA